MTFTIRNFKWSFRHARKQLKLHTSHLCANQSEKDKQATDGLKWCEIFQFARNRHRLETNSWSLRVNCAERSLNLS